MGKKLVVLDLDETIISSIDGFIRINNPYFGTYITREEYREQWHLTRWREGYTDEEWEKKQGAAWGEYALSLGFYRYLPAVPGAREALEYYADLGAEFVALTNRRVEFSDDSMFCLKNLFPDTHFVDFVSTGFIGGKTVSNATLSLTKGEIISKMDASVAIDDQIRHVMSTLEWAVPAVWFGDQRFAELNYEQRMRLVDYAKNGLYHPAATWEKATPFIAGLLK